MPPERPQVVDDAPSHLDLRHDGEARFRRMFEGSADAILLLDTQTNHFVEYNQAALDMLRCTREELSALHPSALSPPLQEDGADSFARANEMIATAVRRGSHRFEWTHRSPHRSDFPVEVVLTPIQLGEAPLLQVVWRDITERRRAEEALRQRQKLESLGVLAGGVAHDFNNLLAAILGHIDLTGAALPADHPANVHLDHAERSVQKAAGLTRQLLAYGGKGTFVLQPLDLSRSVREMADLLAVSVSKRIRMISELSDGLPAFLGDPAQVQQIIMNLMTNANEAIGDGDGTITLRTGQVDLEEGTLPPNLLAQDLAPGRYVTLVVRDSGCGMSPDVLARIFDPFFSTKQPGRGLGLSALLGILKAHRAGIHIESQLWLGSTFTIYLPATTSAAPTPQGGASTLPPGRGEGTVLLVEDEEAVRRSTRAMLEQLGFLVLEAGDGREALTTFASHRGRPTVVLMDLTMPVMDGRTAFLEMRRIDPTVPVVLTSGWAEADLFDRFREAPPSAFLSKPFGTRDIEAALRRAGVLRG